jgi:hypothetical protein
MSSLGVGGGDLVGGGSVVGLRGSTGNSSGPHVHFEVRRAGRPIDPESVLSFDNGGTLAPGWNTVYNGTGGPEDLRPVGTDSPRRRSRTKPGDLVVRIDGKVYEVDLADLTRTARKAAREAMTFGEKMVAALERQISKSQKALERQTKKITSTTAAYITDVLQPAIDASIAAAEAAAEATAAHWERILSTASQVAAFSAQVVDQSRQARESAGQAASSAVMGVIDIGALRGDPAGHMRTWVEDARRFVGAIKRMVANGLPAALIQQVIGLGPIGGWEVAETLANLDASATADVNAAYGEIGALAGEAGRISMDLAVPPALYEAQQRQAEQDRIYYEQQQANAALANETAQAAIEQARETGDAQIAAAEAARDAQIEAAEKRAARTQAKIQNLIDAITGAEKVILDRNGGEVIWRIVKDEERKHERRR